MQNYTIEKSIGGGEISRDNCNLIDYILVTPGLCRANKNNLSQHRNIKSYNENVIKPMIERGEISDGSKGGFDDRKMRYHEAEFYSSHSDDVLVVKFGHSHFLEYKEKINRTKKETEELTQLGIEHFNDPHAFFGRNPGVTGIVLTSDKKLVIGERSVEPDKYDGLLQGAAGHLTFKSKPYDINLENEMLREIEEEMGISKDAISPLEFLGLYSDPSVAGDDLDFCYLANSKVHSDYFTREIWREQIKKPEHKEFYVISDFESLQLLINKGKINDKTFDIIFSTRGALASLKEKDFD